MPRLPKRAGTKQFHHRDYIFGTCGIASFAYVSNTRTRVCQALRLHIQRIEMHLDEKEGCVGSVIMERSSSGPCRCVVIGLFVRACHVSAEYALPLRTPFSSTPRFGRLETSKICEKADSGDSPERLRQKSGSREKGPFIGYIQSFSFTANILLTTLLAFILSRRRNLRRVTLYGIGGIVHISSLSCSDHRSILCVDLLSYSERNFVSSETCHRAEPVAT